MSQLAGSAAKQLVRGMAALDLQLENAGILNQLEDKELPDDVTTVEGEEVSEAVDVRMLLTAFVMLLCLHGAVPSCTALSSALHLPSPP